MSGKQRGSFGFGPRPFRWARDGVIFNNHWQNNVNLRYYINRNSKISCMTYLCPKFKAAVLLSVFISEMELLRSVRSDFMELARCDELCNLWLVTALLEVVLDTIWNNEHITCNFYTHYSIQSRYYFILVLNKFCIKNTLTCTFYTS